MKNYFKKFPARPIKKRLIIGNMSIHNLKREPNLYRKIINILGQIFKSFDETEIFGLSGRMAFIILMSLLPTLFFMFLICSNFIPNFDELVLNLLQIALPRASFNYINEEFTSLLNYVLRLRNFFLLLSCLFGTICAHTLITGINQSYGFAQYQKKSWSWFKSFLLLIGFIGIFTILLLVLIHFFNSLNLFNIIHRIDIPNSILNPSIYITYGLLVLFVFLLLLYTLAPNGRVKIIEALPGSLVATFLIGVVFEIYVYYLNHRFNYILVYGSLSGLFILLIALYFLSLAINIGVKINVLCAIEYD